MRGTVLSLDGVNPVEEVNTIINDAGEGINLESNMVKFIIYKAPHLILSYNLQKE